MSCNLVELESETDELLYQIKRCEDYYEACKELQMAIQLYNEQVYIAHDFFYVASEAIQYAMMAELIKLFDSNKDVMSVIKLLNKCKSDSRWIREVRKDKNKNADYNETVSCFKSFLEEESTKDSLENLRKRRNKYYMHNDAGENNYFHNEQGLTQKYPFSFSEIENLLAEAKAFCSALYKIATEKEWISKLRQQKILEPVRDFSGLKKLLEIVKRQKAYDAGTKMV